MVGQMALLAVIPMKAIIVRPGKSQPPIVSRKGRHDLSKMMPLRPLRPWRETTGFLKRSNHGCNQRSLATVPSLGH
jgi:hypothetical protein